MSTWGGVPSSNIDTDKAAEPEDKKPSDAKEETVEEKTSEEKAKEEDKKSEETKPEEKKSDAVNPDEKKDDNKEAKSEDAQKNAEAEVKAEEEKKSDETKDDNAKTDGEKAKEGTEENAEEGEKTEEKTEAKELKAGETLEIEELAENPIALGAGPEGEGRQVVVVSDFKGLKKEIESTNDGEKKTIVVTAKIDITSTIIIPAGADIVLTSADTTVVKPIGEDTIEMPKDTDTMERRQELVKEAEAKGEKALDETDLDKNQLPNVDIILKRAKEFFETLFKVEKDGKLTIGIDNKDPIFIDGNKDVKTAIKHGSIIDVSGELTMNGGFIAHSNNEAAYSAPIYINDGGNFTMNGGRITSNKNLYYNSAYFEESGAVFVNKGGTFILNHGSIDNNDAPVGGVYLGRSDASGTKFAKFIMNGGIIANNLGPISKNANADVQYYGGAVHVDSCGDFEFNNGILAGNASYHGGAIAVNDNYVEAADGVENVVVKDVDYDKYIEYAGAKYTQNGGLIYKNLAKVFVDGNKTGAGGGIYINSSNATLKGGYLLDNESENMGGGIYVSIAPYTLKLKDVLVSQNKAIDGKIYLHHAGSGGGLWNCPIGNVNFEDFNSVYIFDNESLNGGPDISILGKNLLYYRNYEGKAIGYDKFITRISPVTKARNIIKYLYYGKEVPEWMYNTKEGVYLKAIYDAQTKEEAWRNSNFFIMNNVALKGAGIGSNANITGSGEPGNYEIEIEKKWHESIPEAKKPDSIWVDLFIGEAKYGEIELKKSDRWAAKFSNLPFTNEQLNNMKIRYSIKEKKSDFYPIVDEQLVYNNKDELLSHLFLVKNYPYSEIPVVKKWDESIKEEDIPDSVKVFLLRDGKKVKDKDGKYRYIILSKENKWEGKFDRLPFFELYGMGFEHYSIEEDSEIFIPLVKRRENSIISIEVSRKSDDKKYKMEEDYTGGKSRLDYIPFELHYIYNVGGKEETKVCKSKIKFYPSIFGGTTYDSAIMDVLINGNFTDSDIVVKTYYDENGKPFPRNFGKYKAGSDKNDIVINDEPYILKLVEENGKPVLYVPKLTEAEDDYNLLLVKKSIKKGKKYLELTNYYQPKHRLEIEKKWDTENTDLIPKTLRVKINGKYVDKEVILSPEEWKYMEEFLGKGILSANNYSFSEEDLEKFDGKQSIEKTMEFEVENKALSFKDVNGKVITKEAFLKMIQGKNYSFELKEEDDEKAEVEIKYDADGKLVIVYPVDVTITEVAHVLFTNTEKPEEPPEEPKESKTYVTVSKVWEALGEIQAIQVELYANGEATGKFLTLSEANGWTATFYDLDVEDENGNRYVYTVGEVGAGNGIYRIGDREFEVSYAGNMYEGFTIVNKEVPPEEPEEPEEPHEHEEEEPEEPEEEREKPQDKNRLPKTGVTEDALGIFLGLIILLGLVYIKKKYIVEKSK